MSNIVCGGGKDTSRKRELIASLSKLFSYKNDGIKIVSPNGNSSYRLKRHSNTHKTS
jgi:hypothetical protein